MTPDDLKQRTRQLALRVVRMVESLPNTRTADVIGKQLLRCGMSVGANYRAACRARSRADFTAKMGIVEEEADETLFWLELLEESRLVTAAKLSAIKLEANELIAITVASIKTARRNRSSHSALRVPNSALE